MVFYIILNIKKLLTAGVIIKSFFLSIEEVASIINN